MAHFARTESDATWTTGNYVTLISDWTSIDAKCAQAINGDDGGTWAPTSVISIGGQGLVLSGPCTVFGTGLLQSAVPGAFQLGDGDYPVLGTGHSGQSGTVKTSCLAGRSNVAGFAQASPAAIPTVPSALVPNMPAGGAQTQLVQGSALQFVVGLTVPHGATLSSATVHWIVGFTHTATPTPPRMRIVRLDANGNATPLTSTAAGGDASGFVSPVISSGAGWFNAGQPQSLTITCDQNNVVDNTQFDYVLQVFEETGITGFPWSAQGLPPVVAATTGQNISLRGPATIDSVALSTGNSVLVKDQTDPTYNGIWTVNTGSGVAWTRTNISGLAGGAAVQVGAGGFVNGNTAWQLPQTQGQQLPQLWAPSATYTLGMTVSPSTSNGLIFQVTTAGVSAAGEPSWPTQPGATIADNSVVWTALSNQSAQLVWSPMPNTPAVFGSGLPLFGNIWGNVDVAFTGRTLAQFE